MTARVLRGENVHEIVLVMLKDPIMAQNKERFYNSLGLPPGELLDLQTSAKSSGSESYTFFTSCLHNWISRKGLEAKFGVLTSILRKEGFALVADEISKGHITGYSNEHVVRQSITEACSSGTTVTKQLKRRSSILKIVTLKKAATAKACALKSKWWPDEKLLVNSFYERKTNQGLLVEELFQTLTQQGNLTAVISQKVTVSGLGGVGKTTIAKWYARHYEEKYDHIIWIDCGEGSLRKSFDELSLDLKVEQSGESDLKKLTRVCFQILEDKKCLFIFDNAEVYVGCNGISDVLPKKENFHSIITSRNRDWGSESGYGRIYQIPLDVFSTHESISFLKANLKPELIQEKELYQLCDLLGNHPLALQIATSTLNNYNVGFADYIKLIQTTDQIIEMNFDDYEKTINTTLKTSLDFIEQGEDNFSQLAYRILLLFGYILPDNVPINFFQAVEQCERWKIQAAMKLLERHSLISIRMNDNEIGSLKYSIHRLLQKVIRFNGKNSEESTLRRILECKGYSHLKLLPYTTFADESLKREFPKLRVELVDQQKLIGLILTRQFDQACRLSRNIYTDLQTSASRFNHVICLKKCKLFDKSLSHLLEMFIHVSGSREYDLSESGLLPLQVEPTKTMVGIQIFIINMLKEDIAEAQKIFELTPNIQVTVTDETLSWIIQVLNSKLCENSGFRLSIAANRICLKTCIEHGIADVLISDCKINFDMLQWRNLRFAKLEYTRFTSEQSESLRTGNFFPPTLTNLSMKTADVDTGGSEIPFGNPWLCLNQLEYLQTLDLMNCRITLTDVQLPMRLKSLVLRNVSFLRNGEKLQELTITELINFSSLKTLSLTHHRIEDKKEPWLLDMTGNLNLDTVRLEGNSVVCQNWEDANWTIAHLILNNIELKRNRMKIKDLELRESSVDLSHLPSTVQSFRFDMGVSRVRCPQDCFLPNLKYLNICRRRLPSMKELDILDLLDRCPNLVGLKFVVHGNDWNKECREIDSNALQSRVRELHLKGVRVLGDQVRQLERLVISSYTTEEAEQLLTKLHPEQLYYKQSIFNRGNDKKLVDLIRCQFKSIVLGPISWKDFKMCALSSYVDEEGEYYIFQNQRGTKIDYDNFSTYFKFPPIER